MTALRAAAFRAQHQSLDRPLVFDDPLAGRIIAAAGPVKIPRVASVRAFLAARSRFTEDSLANSRMQGCAQYAILGAGLDTYAYRNTGLGLRVFEIDHPETQAWKRGLLAAEDIAPTLSVTYVPVDFASGSLIPALLRAGFDPGEPAFFSWLGVTPYLTGPDVLRTLAEIYALNPANGVVLDYLLPPSALSWRGRVAHFLIARHVARLGEPLQSNFTPGAIRAHLLSIGFSHVEDLDCPALNDRYFVSREDGLRISGRITNVCLACRK